MSIRLVANVLDYVHGLPHGTKLLLLCLADHADDAGRCWPSFQSLANRSDMSRRHVIRVMSDLEQAGFIARAEQRPYKPTIYQLRIPSSDTHVTSDASDTSDTHVTTLVTPTSLGSDTHVTRTSDIAMSPEPSVNRQRTVKESSEGKPKKTLTAVPDSFDVTTDLYQWAAKELQMDRGLVDRETGKFLDHHRAKGSTMKDWGAAWKYWMRRSVEFRPAVRGEKVVETVQPFDPAKFQRLRVTGGAA